MLTSRGSQAHQVPQTSRPQIDPVAMATPVRVTPISAPARANRSQRRSPPIRYAPPPASTTANAAYATQATGTWTYISRCAWPCTSSGGATQPPATVAAAASPPANHAMLRRAAAALAVSATRSTLRARMISLSAPRGAGSRVVVKQTIARCDQ
ncbi:hypothetical protein JD77_04509 [Micromonospora olivasterospora]|uniref:Uncharacterized protein n=1 Tax=Micromonospora olivasterospora TaxID=1880 RepID=A0A562IEP0_MICOL|nr:hypothetical protein [Micromonospora olivasterospora]TWH69499.1 hypothetical protein JD77_04509 [Micromonospora olivasterospora]